MDHLVSWECFVNTNPLIAKIESDIAAHARFDKKILGLSIAALSIGLVMGTILSATPPFAIFFMTPQTVAVSLGLIILAGIAASNILAFQTRLSARYGYGILFLIILGLYKWSVYQFAPHDLLNDVISFNSIGHNISCFFLGFAPSVAVMLSSIVIHWNLQMSPNHRVRVVTGVVSASTGLIAQAMFCPFLNLAHLLVAHIGQVIAICAMVGFLDHYLMRIWFRKDLHKS